MANRSQRGSQVQRKTRGKYGNANIGTVAPASVHKVRRPRPNKPHAFDLSVLLDQGQYVENVVHDRVLNRLRTSKAMFSSRLRYGVVYRDIPSNEAVADIVNRPDDWDDIWLPANFVEGDALPNVADWPEGMGLVKLSPGSMPLDGSAWFADEDFSVPPFAEATGIPEIVAVTVDPDNTSLVTLWLSEAPTSLKPLSEVAGLFSALALDLDNPVGINSVELASDAPANRVLVGLSREILQDRQDIVMLNVSSGAILFSNNRANVALSMTPISIMSERWRYVYVWNRTGGTIAAGTPVLLSGADYVFDNADNPKSVRLYDLVAVGGGGGSSSTLLVTVLGGNPLAPAAIGDPVTGTVALPVPLTDDNGEPTASVLPTVADWTALEIPTDYRIGDPIPAMPDGLCLVKLERPYSFGAKSWDAAISPSVEVVTTGPVEFVSASVDIQADAGVVKVYFNRNLSNIVYAGLVLVKDTTNNTTIDVSNVIVSENVASIYLTADIDPSHTYTLTISKSKFITPIEDGLPQQLSPLVQSEAIRFLGDAFIVTYAVNRRAYQSFYAGDLVTASDEGTVLVDDNGLSVPVLDIVSNASNVRSPHTHANPRYDGTGSGGPALAL